MNKKTKKNKDKVIQIKKSIKLYIYRILILIIISTFSFLVGFYIVSEKASKIKMKEIEIQKNIEVK